MFHRIVATIVGLVLVWTLISAWRRRSIAPGQAWVAVAAGILFVAQSSVGALVVLWQRPVFIAGLHLALATAVWGTLVILAVLAARQLRDTPQDTAGESGHEAEVVASDNQDGEVSSAGDVGKVGGVRQTFSSY